MHNAKSLALRDGALAALLGAVATADFGSDFGADFGDDFGADDFGADDFGDDFGADAPAAPKPTAQAAMQAWQEKKARTMGAKRRLQMLNPNADSAVKIERYVFPISQNVVLGAATALTLTGNPDVTIRPQRVVMNAPCAGFATISTMQVSNISVQIGGGALDAFFYNAGGVGVQMDMPTITPAQRASITGTTTVLVPPGYVPAAAFTFSVALIGPSKMTG